MNLWSATVELYVMCLPRKSQQGGLKPKEHADICVHYLRDWSRPHHRWWFCTCLYKVVPPPFSYKLADSIPRIKYRYILYINIYYIYIYCIIYIYIYILYIYIYILYIIYIYNVCIWLVWGPPPTQNNLRILYNSHCFFALPQHFFGQST